MATFREQCETISDHLGLELIDIYADQDGDRQFADDGMLHIVRHNQRAVFDVSDNQMLKRGQQNHNVKKVLGLLGIPKTPAVIVNCWA